MPRYNFYLRSPSSSSATAVHLFIQYNNQRVVFPTGEHIHPKYWESDKAKRAYQRAKKTMPGAPEFNHRLEQIELRARNVFRAWLEDHDELPPTPHELQSALKAAFHRQVGPTPDTSFFGFIRAFINGSATRTNPNTGRPPTKSTITKYRTTLLRLEEYAKASNSILTWEAIDLKFYDGWTEWMRTEHNMATNTVGKHIQTLKTFLNAATDGGINTNRTFQSSRFRSVTEESDNISLNEHELEQLLNTDLSEHPRLERVRDMFLVCAWTGLRFSDLHQVSRDNIANGNLKIRQGKTDKDIIIPILPVVEQLLTKYNNNLPETISNQRFNQYLKEACRHCPVLNETITLRITKGGKRIERHMQKADAITSHTARRSFASNLYRRGLQAISIMAITGHRTEKEFLKYIKVGAEEHALLLSRLF